MSADNFVLIASFTSGEFILMDIGDSGFPYDVWEKKEKTDHLLVNLAHSLEWTFAKTDSLDKANTIAEDYRNNRIVEYSTTRFALPFPLPSKEEFDAAKQRWEEDRPRRELQWTINTLEAHIRHLVEINIPGAIAAITNTEKELAKEKDEIWVDVLKGEIEKFKNKRKNFEQALVNHQKELDAAKQEYAMRFGQPLTRRYSGGFCFGENFVLVERFKGRYDRGL